MPISEDADAGKNVRFIDLDFSALPLEQVLSEIRRLSGGDRFSYIVTPNVDHVVKLYPRHDNDLSAAFRAAYSAAALRLCDSRILAAMARLHGVRLPLVPGSDLTVRLFQHCFAAGDKIAIVGGAEDTLKRIGHHFAGPLYVQHIPPMGVLNNPAAQDAIAEFIAHQKPDFILFAFGAPQSEIVAHRCSDAGFGGVGLCIGASIDFLLGDKKRAPVWMQRAGLEWAFRLASEPTRLWRRYLVDGPRIFAIVLRLQSRRLGR